MYKSACLFLLMCVAIAQSMAQTNTRCTQDFNGEINCKTTSSNNPDLAAMVGGYGQLEAPNLPAYNPYSDMMKFQQIQQIELQKQRMQIENASRLRQLEASAPEWQTGYLQSSNQANCIYSHPSGFFIKGNFYPSFSTSLPSTKQCPPALQVSKTNQSRLPSK